MEEVPIPVPGPGGVLIEVKAAGVCLSDVHLIDGSLVPLFATSDTVTVGHEVSGVIHTLGSGLKRGLPVGTRVTPEAGRTCGQCAGCVRHRPCTQMLTAGIDYDGGWAEYVTAREDTLIPLPDSLSFDQAAIIPDAVSTPYAAVVATAPAMRCGGGTQADRRAAHRDQGRSARYRCGGTRKFDYSSVVPDGQDPFQAIAQDMLAAGIGSTGMIDAAESYLFEAGEVVNFAITWIEEKPGRAR